MFDKERSLEAFFEFLEKLDSVTGQVSLRIYKSDGTEVDLEIAREELRERKFRIVKDDEEAG